MNSRRQNAGLILIGGLLLYALCIALTKQTVGDIPGQFEIFGKSIAYGRVIEGYIYTLEGLIFVFALEIFIFGYDRSGANRLLSGRSNTGRLDIWAFIFAQARLMGILSILFSFGIYFLANRFLNEHFSSYNLYARVAEVSTVLAAIMFILAFTYFDYWNHRILHNKFLWPIHRFHHSATELNLITSYRNHPADGFITPFTRTLPIALIGAPPNFAFYFFALNAFYQLVVHVNEDFSWGWFGKYILLSPLHHRVHHSCVPGHFDKNYGILAVWDHLHGTYHPETSEAVLGVRDRDYETEGNLLKIYLRDFRDFISGQYLGPNSKS